MVLALLVYLPVEGCFSAAVDIKDEALRDAGNDDGADARLVQNFSMGSGTPR